MSSDSEYSSEDEVTEWVGKVAEGTCTGNLGQTRFKRIPDAYLNKETVAGIRDMKLGKIKNGKAVGAPTIRFDTGKNSGFAPHINIDPEGLPNANNPHIKVHPGVIKGANVIDKTLKYAGITLTVAALAIDIWRIFFAFREDVHLRENGDEIVRALKTKKLKISSGSRRRRDSHCKIIHLENALKDVKRNKKNVPAKSIKTLSSVCGGWGGGIVGGHGGAWAGAQTGAICGAVFGPAGAAVGAPIGAVIGAICGGIGAGYYGSKLAEAAAEEILKLTD